jgi:hypothetical protein
MDIWARIHQRIAGLAGEGKTDVYTRAEIGAALTAMLDDAARG